MEIKLFVMDVDGTLTDGKIYMGSSGEIIKAFNIKDGYGIRNILPKYGILPIILTGRKSDIVNNRCRELGIIHIYQQVDNKKEFMETILKEINSSWEEVAYIGDDENDILCMESAKVKACPADAIKHVKYISDYICIHRGGEGAVREFIDWIVENKL